MRVLDLTGAWEVRSRNETHPIPAEVPGTIHQDLLAAGRIPDPFFRDNEKAVQWVSNEEWVYSREFHVSHQLLASQKVMLQCDGLDTLATVTINGTVVGTANNMFRSWEFSVRDALVAGRNVIEISFSSALQYTHARQARRYLHSWLSREDGAPYIRKEQCNYGWDWGPKLITCGIWRPLRLVGWDTARIASVQVRQDHLPSGKVELQVEVATSAANRTRWRVTGPDVRSTVAVSLGEELLFQETFSAPAGEMGGLRLRLPDPQLWWPNGMGEQPLYLVRVELRDAEDNLLDVWAKRIGLRTLRLDRHRDAWGESFQFVANGVPFFAKGANWIPADVFAPRVPLRLYVHLLTSAADAHMNMIRVWGGGIYEEETFYDLCDELGLCVWQDFMFACGCYPTFDKAFLRNVRLEAEENVRRLRHHTSLALWCGNNELEQGLCGPLWTRHQMPWREYAKIFDQMLPEILGQLDPDRDYWPGSPHNPGRKRRDCNNPESGDAHLWSVWHGREPFEWYRTSQHRFCSEFGFQSFPEPRTIETFALPEDRNISSYVMDHHQKSWVGNAAITSYMLSWYRQPKDFESFVWMSQILQGMAMKYAVEHWRRLMPRSMGALYWQLNDTWPGPSWSSIDYFGRWKALHFLARRFFAPVLVSLVEKPETRQVEVWISNDLREEVAGDLVLKVTDCAGRELRQEEVAVRADAGSSRMVTQLSFEFGPGSELVWGKPSAHPQLTPGGVPIAQTEGPRELLVWAELRIGGDVVSRNLATFVRPKHLPMRDPAIRARVKKERDGSYLVALTARSPALHVWLELDGHDARVSDNFFDLEARTPYAVRVCPGTPLPKAEVESALRVRSLYDTDQ